MSFDDKWWKGEDSNLRTPKRADLQSVSGAPTATHTSRQLPTFPSNSMPGSLPVGDTNRQAPTHGGVEVGWKFAARGLRTGG